MRPSLPPPGGGLALLTPGVRRRIGDALTQWTATVKSAASSATQYSSEALARLREQEVARRVQGSLSSVAATVRDPSTHDQARRKAQESWNWLSSTTSTLFAQASQRAAELRENWEAGQGTPSPPRREEEEEAAQAAQADASSTGAVHSPHSAVEEDWLQQQIAAAHAELGGASLEDTGTSREAPSAAHAGAEPPAVDGGWDADGWADAGDDDWDQPAGPGDTADGAFHAGGDSDGDEPAGVAGFAAARTPYAGVEASASAEQHASTDADADADFFASFGVAD